MFIKADTDFSKAANRKRLSYIVPAPIRYTARFLEFLSPRLATAFVLKLFFTPLKFPLPQREKEAFQKARHHRLKTDQSEFEAMEWEGEGPKVLFVHGWSGRGTQFFRIIEALQEKKFHVFAINAPAHGGSSKKKTHLFEFVDAIEVMVSQFGHFPYAVGHSLGGMAIFNALKRNLKPEKIVVIGTPANIRSVVMDFCDRVQVSQKIGNRIIAKIEERYKMNSNEASTDYLAGNYNLPGLIIHDIDDLDIDISNAHSLKEKWPNANLVITEGKGHRKILMDIKVIETIVGFLE